MLYTFAFMGALIGAWLSPPNIPKNIWSWQEFIVLQLKLVPCWPLMYVSELSFKSAPFATKLVCKYLLPPFIMNVYLFGISQLFQHKV